MSTTFFLLSILVFFAYLIGSTAGFGAGIITLTLGVQFLPLSYLVPVIIPLNVLVCLYLAARYHRYIATDILFRRILPLAIMGLAGGIVVFYLVRTSQLKTAYGGFVVLLASSELWRIRTQGKDDNARTRNNFWLLAGGFIQGLWVSGGPILVYWANRSLPDKRRFRATLSGMWLILNGGLLIIHLSLGTINRATLTDSLWLLPALGLGLIGGEWLHHRLPERAFRIWINVVLALAGLTVVLRG